MPDERSPLLTTHVAEDYLTHRPSSPRADPAPGFTLHQASTALLAQPRLSSPSDSSFPALDPLAPPQAYLAVLLYSLHLLSSPEEQPKTIRGALADSSRRHAVRTRISDEVERWLDVGGSGSEEAGEDELEDILWQSWPVGAENAKTYACAIDLLLPPYVSDRHRPSPYLSHPLIRHVVSDTWARGRPSAQDASIRRKLGSAITPRRAHLLHLASSVTLLGLTLSLSLRPGHLICPSDLDGDPSEGFPSASRPTATEIAYLVFSVASLLSTFQQRTPLSRHLLLLPTHLTPLLFLLLASPPTSYSVLTLSIPFLTLGLLLPAPPSLAYLFLPSTLLPLSALLAQILVRSFTSSGILLPLALLIFALFAWSMNGDIFRAFLAVPAVPVEQGIAPFPARVALFVTVSLIVLLALVLSAARAIAPTTRDGDSAGSRLSAEDGWEREFGVQIARDARERWAIATRDLLFRPEKGVRGKRTPSGGQAENGVIGHNHALVKEVSTRTMAVIVPLNVLVLPLDMAISLEGLVPSTSILRHLGAKARTAREWLVLCLLGPPCILLSYLDGLSGIDHAWDV